MEHLTIVLGTLENGKLWKGHFGDAEFLVKYKIFPNGSYEFVERIKNSAKNEDEKHLNHGNLEKRRKVENLIQNCDCIAACVMSPNFKKMAEDSTIQQIVVKGCSNLEDFIKKIADNYDLINKKVINRKNGIRDINIPVL
jgi:hypothetical protein